MWRGSVVVRGPGKPAERREVREWVMKDARAGAERRSLKMASLPMTTISIRSQLLLLLLLAQVIMSDSCVSASARPSSSWMPRIIFRP